MTFYFYYLCVGIIWQELAEEGRRRKKSREICCINCGSNMVIECGGPAARGAAVVAAAPLSLDLWPLVGAAMGGVDWMHRFLEGGGVSGGGEWAGSRARIVL